MHFADELRHGNATQVRSHRLFGALGHAAHDPLHVAADLALSQRFPLVDANYRAGFDGIVNIHEGNAVRLSAQPGATVLAAESFDQSSPSQREQQPAHNDRIGIHARGEPLRTDHFPWRESQRGHDVNGESKLLVDHVAINVIV